MSVDDVVPASVVSDDSRRKPAFQFERHGPHYRDNFVGITEEMQSKCPVAWSDTHGGHWVAASAAANFTLARSQAISSDHDVRGKRKGYKGISIPTAPNVTNIRGGIAEMDEPEHREYRAVLNPFLSPAAIEKWHPVIDEVIRATLDDKIETGSIDFVDDLVNVVPAVLTLAMLGIPIEKWEVYCEPVHASIYTPPNSPDMERIGELKRAMGADLRSSLTEIREKPRPGMIDALVRAKVDGKHPDDMEVLGVLSLIIGGGFDTTTALSSHAFEWLSQNPDQRTSLSEDRDVLLNPATEEFLRYYTPLAGAGRTFAADCQYDDVKFQEGERLWLSWAMANRDPEMFEDPNEIDLLRKANRHFSFGLGVHRCIGSNLARTLFKRMLLAVLDRMPDYLCDPAGAVHYESIGTIQGMRNLPATFTPSPRLGAGLDETLGKLQTIIDEQRLAEPGAVSNK
ncbi:cytochrome P450 [Rhodococcus sp. KBS0724]|jgi:cytochrome P450|uniref:cytochrome P450 n=1 Tax=Rhodococcus sp. KBS0724 TaxID=1179674 RepID=UPI00110E48FF|nr:cytochrome P450 [Rhodococcus sp. KBS0724]TSD40234.1 cytochrome P450 [Rhodococcus sp. KBS0724]